MANEELEERLHEGIAALDEVAGEIKPPEARDGFEEVTLEEFWQSWPQLRAWGEWLWRLIDAERGDKATPAGDSPHDEIGGSG